MSGANNGVLGWIGSLFTATTAATSDAEVSQQTNQQNASLQPTTASAAIIGSKETVIQNIDKLNKLSNKVNNLHEGTAELQLNASILRWQDMTVEQLLNEFNAMALQIGAQIESLNALEQGLFAIKNATSETKTEDSVTIKSILDTSKSINLVQHLQTLEGLRDYLNDAHNLRNDDYRLVPYAQIFEGKEHIVEHASSVVTKTNLLSRRISYYAYGNTEGATVLMQDKSRMPVAEAIAKINLEIEQAFKDGAIGILEPFKAPVAPQGVKIITPKKQQLPPAKTEVVPQQQAQTKQDQDKQLESTHQQILLQKQQAELMQQQELQRIELQKQQQQKPQQLQPQVQNHHQQQPPAPIGQLPGQMPTGGQIPMPSNQTNQQPQKYQPLQVYKNIKTIADFSKRIVDECVAKINAAKENQQLKQQAENDLKDKRDYLDLELTLGKSYEDKVKSRIQNLIKGVADSAETLSTAIQVLSINDGNPNMVIHLVASMELAVHSLKCLEDYCEHWETTSSIKPDSQKRDKARKAEIETDSANLVNIAKSTSELIVRAKNFLPAVIKTEAQWHDELEAKETQKLRAENAVINTAIKTIISDYNTKDLANNWRVGFRFNDRRQAQLALLNYAANDANCQYPGDKLAIVAAVNRSMQNEANSNEIWRLQKSRLGERLNAAFRTPQLQAIVNNWNMFNLPNGVKITDANFNVPTTEIVPTISKPAVSKYCEALILHVKDVLQTKALNVHKTAGKFR